MNKFLWIYLIFYQLVELSLQELNKHSIECFHGQVIPHPTNCRKFIKCGLTDSQNIILECAKSTLFNPNTGFCDFPENVVCRKFEFVTRRPLLSVNLVPPIVEYFHCKPGCIKPHPDDCGKFILCGKKLSEYKVFNCPKSLLYNPYIKSCDIAQNVVCKTYSYEFLTFPNLENSTTIQLSTTMIPSTTLVITTKIQSTTTVSSTLTVQILNSTTLNSISSTTNPVTNITSTTLNRTYSTTTKIFQTTHTFTNQSKPMNNNLTTISNKETTETTLNYETTNNESKISFTAPKTSTELFTRNMSNHTTDYLKETTFQYSNLTTSTLYNLTHLFNSTDFLNQTTLTYLFNTTYPETTELDLTTLTLISSTLDYLNLTLNSTRLFLNETTSSPTRNQTSLLIDKLSTLNPFANNHSKSSETTLKTSTHNSELFRQANCTSRKNLPNIYFRENGFYYVNGTSGSNNGQNNIYRKKLTKDYVYEEFKYLKSLFSPSNNNNNNQQEDNFKH